jgi:signal transduction histidine kinase
VTFGLIALTLAIAAYFDLILYPQRDFPILYFVPVMIASLRSSGRVVRFLVGPIVLFSLVSFFLERPRPELWFLPFVALLLACYLAIRLVDLREAIGRLYAAESEARASAEAQRERMSNFVSVIAHDVRQPLAGAMRFLDLIQLAVVRKDLDRIGSAASTSRLALEQLDGMLEDLTESVRLEMGRLELRLEDVELGSFTRELIERLEDTLDVGRVQVIALDEIVVRADRRWLERVAGNLLGNALKYSEAPDPVTIRVERSQQEAVIAVADRGNGIASEDLPHVFERGYRSSWARRRADGLGLGLYITRLLVDSLGGRVWAESRLGFGSTFSVALPLVAATEAPATEPPVAELLR